MDVIKKMLQFTTGVVFIGKENLEVLMKDLEKKYDLKPEVSKKIARDILAETKESGGKFIEDFEEHVKEILKERFGMECSCDCEGCDEGCDCCSECKCEKKRIEKKD